MPPSPGGSERRGQTVTEWKGLKLSHFQIRAIEAIREGTPPKVDFVDGLWSVAIGEAGHISIDEGRPVDTSELIPTP